jgi:hypothetical protein
LWLAVLLFSIPAMTRDVGDHGDFAALCLRPSATTPHPIDALLKTKAQPSFDRAVTDRSKPVFSVFQPSNRPQFQPDFFIFTVRSAEGRGHFNLPDYQITPFTRFCLATLESGNQQYRHFVKELLERTLHPEAQLILSGNGRRNNDENCHWL